MKGNENIMNSLLIHMNEDKISVSFWLYSDRWPMQRGAARFLKRCKLRIKPLEYVRAEIISFKNKTTGWHESHIFLNSFDIKKRPSCVLHEIYHAACFIGAAKRFARGGEKEAVLFEDIYQLYESWKKSKFKDKRRVFGTRQI